MQKNMSYYSQFLEKFHSKYSASYSSNCCYRTNATAPRGADILLTQITRRNPSKPDQIQQNGQESRSYVVLIRIMLRSKEREIPSRKLRPGSSPPSGTIFIYMNHKFALNYWQFVFYKKVR